jgi:hypothetical protein
MSVASNQKLNVSKKVDKNLKYRQDGNNIVPLE